MIKRLLGIVVFFIVVILGITTYFYISGKTDDSSGIRSERIVAANEIEQLARMGKLEEAANKAAKLQQSIRNLESRSYSSNDGVLLLCGICLIFLFVVFGYLYFMILRPFEKMKDFVGNIARGNFDMPLNYERSNYFGEFTWAFDSMRREITKARSCEREATENNKTVIATLSHDIKTPISSIRAYAEGLEANLDNTPEKRSKYLSVIMRKCDEVSKLTNDLFLHSLSDLEKLKINLEEFELCSFLECAINEIAAEHNDICFYSPDFKALVNADKNRMMQIMENLINNARKYAKTQIDVKILLKGHYVNIYFRDYGSGICDEDMPFIFDKFYRGKNCGSEQGSGLGLYIVKYIMEQMWGSVVLDNCGNGLEVVLSLPVSSV